MRTWACVLLVRDGQRVQNAVVTERYRNNIFAFNYAAGEQSVLYYLSVKSRHGVARMPKGVRVFECVPQSGTVPPMSRHLDLIDRERTTTPPETSPDAWGRQANEVPWRRSVEEVLAAVGTLAALHARGECHGAVCPEALRLTGGALMPGERTPDTRNDPREESRRSSDSIRRCTAPEKILNQPPDARSDVYAVGAILYRLLCNRYPFRSTDLAELRREIIEDAPQPPRQLAHDIPPELERLCLRLLAKEPSARPADGGELERELRSVLAFMEPPGQSNFDRAAARQPTPVARECELVLVLTWEPSSRTGRLQQALRDDIERRHGSGLLQTETETVARLAPVDGLPTGMPTLLYHALSFLVEPWIDAAGVSFSLDSAETETLKHRATRLNGRISAHGLELSAASMDVVRRWFPCRVCDDSSTRFEVEAGPRTRILISVSDETRDPFSRRAPLVGRAAQLSILKARWDQARVGMGQIVLLIGEEGTGKTRLLQELRGHAADSPHAFHWAEWTCRHGGEGPRPNPAIEYVRDPRARQGVGLTEAERAALTALQPRERWQRAVASWLKRMAADAPTVFVIEDLQWVDQDTLRFIHTIVDRGFHERVLTILTCRPEFETPWGSRAHQTHIALSRLSSRHAASLYSALVGDPAPSAGVVAQLMDASDGVPLYVKGFARSRSHRGQAPENS